jgi:hypothetical protein
LDIKEVHNMAQKGTLRAKHRQTIRRTIFSLYTRMDSEISKYQQEIKDWKNVLEIDKKNKNIS